VTSIDIAVKTSDRLSIGYLWKSSRAWDLSVYKVIKYGPLLVVRDTDDVGIAI
jgi:hypothetical protein